MLPRRENGSTQTQPTGTFDVSHLCTRGQSPLRERWWKRHIPSSRILHKTTQRRMTTAVCGCFPSVLQTNTILKMNSIEKAVKFLTVERHIYFTWISQARRCLRRATSSRWLRCCSLPFQWKKRSISDHLLVLPQKQHLLPLCRPSPVSPAGMLTSRDAEVTIGWARAAADCQRQDAEFDPLRPEAAESLPLH